MSAEQEETCNKIPLLTCKAGPCEGVAFQERLKEELRALITVFCISLGLS